MTILQDILAAVGWQTRVNENFSSVSPAALFSKKHSTTTGLTLGYYGGILDGVSYADGTHLLTASTTRYVVAKRSDGVVSSATGTTNWSDTTNYKRMGVAVVGASTITSWTDWREFAAGAAGAAGDVVGPASSVSGRVATFSGTSGKIIQDGGTLLSDLATQAYVDGVVQGLSWKKAVRASTTVAGTLASSFENGDSIDGVTLATGDRILIKNQASGSENGIYTVNASGAPTRATDADTGIELVNATVLVSEGTTLADTQWTCSTNAPITVGSTALTFAQISAGGGGMTNPLTTTGDIIYSSSGTTPARLGIGTNTTDVLGVASGIPAWVKRTPLIIPIACSDETTALTAGTSKVTFRMPCAMTLTDIRASVTTAPTGGTLLTVDVNESGTTILSTKLTFDASEKTTTTAATPRVISDANLADDAEMTIDIDAVGSTLAGAGLKVYLIGMPA